MLNKVFASIMALSTVSAFGSRADRCTQSINTANNAVTITNVKYQGKSFVGEDVDTSHSSFSFNGNYLNKRVAAICKLFGYENVVSFETEYEDTEEARWDFTWDSNERAKLPLRETHPRLVYTVSKLTCSSKSDE